MLAIAPKNKMSKCFNIFHLYPQPEKNYKHPDKQLNSEKSKTCLGITTDYPCCTNCQNPT